MDLFDFNTVSMLVLDATEDGVAAVREFARGWTTPIDLVEAATVDDCRRRLGSHRFDIALIDIDTPRAASDDLGEALRRHGRIFVAATSSQPLRPLSQFKALRPYDLLLKPYRRDALGALFRAYDKVSAPVRALVVDESETVRRVIARVVGMSAFAIAVEETGDGADALARLGATGSTDRGYDLLVIDVTAASYDAVELIRRARDLPRPPHVIAMSDEPEPVVRRRVPATLCEPFLHKPFFPVDVDRSLRRFHGLPEPIAASLGAAQRPAAAR